MKRVLSLMLVLFLTSFTVITPASANELAELKQMIQDMRNDYESKIEMLEAKIEKLEANQSAQVEQKVMQRVSKMRNEIKEEIKAESWNVDYVGHDKAAYGPGGLEVTSPTGHSTVSVGGYMDHEFEDFEDTNSTFDQHRWVVVIAAQIGERLRFLGEYEIEHGGPSVGGEGKVEQAYVDYLINDMINFRGGAVLVPMGRLNINHDSDARDLTARPLVMRDVIPTTWTESGLGFFGELNPTIGDYEDLLVNYEIYVINGLDDDFTDTGLRGARGSLGSDNNNSKSVVGRMVLSPAEGHELGLAGYFGKYNAFGDSISGKAVDWKSTFGPLELIGEWALFNVNVPDVSDAGVTDIPDELTGYYVQANYHFWPEFLDDTFLGRSFNDPTFTLVGRYDHAEIADGSLDTDTADNEEERWTLGFNYRPVESWVMKFEYQWNETENEALERGDKDGFFWSVAMGF